MGSGIFRKRYVDLRHIGAGRDKIIGIAIIHRIAIARIVDCLLQQPHADTHHDGAGNLVSRRLHIDDASAVNDAYGTADAEPGNPWIPFDLNKLCAKGVSGVVVRRWCRTPDLRCGCRR